MKIPNKLIALFSLWSLMLGCAANVGTISSAKLHNLSNGDISTLNENQVSKLNEILSKGTARVIGEKWQTGNMIEATLDSDEKLFIYSYLGGYIKISTKKNIIELNHLI